MAKKKKKELDKEVTETSNPNDEILEESADAQSEENPESASIQEAPEQTDEIPEKVEEKEPTKSSKVVEPKTTSSDRLDVLLKGFLDKFPKNAVKLSPADHREICSKFMSLVNYLYRTKSQENYKRAFKFFCKHADKCLNSKVILGYITTITTSVEQRERMSTFYGAFNYMHRAKLGKKAPGTINAAMMERHMGPEFITFFSVTVDS